MDRSSLHTL
jgi:hypothetical protein